MDQIKTFILSAFLTFTFFAGCNPDNDDSRDDNEDPELVAGYDQNASDGNANSNAEDPNSSQNDGNTTGSNQGNATVDSGSQENTGPSSGAKENGVACTCDDECAGTEVNPGFCLQGICAQVSSDPECAAGSTESCPAGSRCWSQICYPDCDAVECAGGCDEDGSCVPTEEMRNACDHTCSIACPTPEPTCESDSDCEAGLVCGTSARCIMDVGTVPAGPIPTCDNIPSWECEGNETYCGELLPFEPDLGPGYWDYPLNGERDDDQYRSYARRDMIMLIKHVSAKVDCLASGWAGNGGEIGLGDMSEENGDIPGTRDGRPGHPEGTHVDGHDMDIGYFQVGTPDNKLRSVCPHCTDESGYCADGSWRDNDTYHCLGEAEFLDVWRTALWLGIAHVTPQLRVIGVDGRVGEPVVAAIEELCANGWLNNSACQYPYIAFETENDGAGWYYFHHHHFHISLSGRSGAGFSAIPEFYWIPPMSMIENAVPTDAHEDPRSAWVR